MKKVNNANRNLPSNYPNLFDANGKPLYDTDWQDEAYRTAISHNHQISSERRNG